jgi:hypothetical protein
VATNSFFPKNNLIEQKLLQGLVTESIQILGHDVYYLPRKLQRLDLILGEDVLSKFDLAVPLEMYMMNQHGEQDLLSKFGLQVKEQVTYYVSTERWIAEVQSPHSARMYNSLRPQEGDLIYEPLSTSLYEITYVDKEDPYFQLGSNWQWKLTCEVFAYSSESISTGIPAIDSVEEDYSKDSLHFELLLEDGEKLLLESGDAMITDIAHEVDAPEFDKAEAFNEAVVELEWSASNPFSELGFK